ncbi:MAG: hypothetical protein WAP03_21785 [Methylorubrum rhodinum]
MVRFRQALIKLLAGRMPVAMNVAFRGQIIVERPHAFMCGNEYRGAA